MMRVDVMFFGDGGILVVAVYSRHHLPMVSSASFGVFFFELVFVIRMLGHAGDLEKTAQIPGSLF
jgi:hypothetical protein